MKRTSGKAEQAPRARRIPGLGGHLRNTGLLYDARRRGWRLSPAFDLNHPEAGMPVGVGPLKDAPEAPVYDLADEKVK